MIMIILFNVYNIYITGHGLNKRVFWIITGLPQILITAKLRITAILEEREKPRKIQNRDKSGIAFWGT